MFRFIKSNFRRKRALSDIRAHVRVFESDFRRKRISARNRAFQIVRRCDRAEHATARRQQFPVLRFRAGDVDVFALFRFGKRDLETRFVFLRIPFRSENDATRRARLDRKSTRLNSSH